MTPIRKRMLDAAHKYGFTPHEVSDHVRDWLEAHGRYSCPFYGTQCDICAAMFPKTKLLGNNERACPCNEFGVKYVEKRAREALK